MKPSRKSGFTLIEIMVVLVLATILSSITFGAFRSISQGNKRTTCQSNLSQIYKSARLYAQDYNGKFPYLNTRSASAMGATAGMPNQAETPLGGIGLWGLYAYPTALTNLCTPNDFSDYNSDLNLPRASEDGTQQLAGYVRSAKIFHCPADRFDKPIRLPASAGCGVVTMPTASLTVKSGNSTYLNPSYLSYQTVDDTGNTPRDTYLSFRDPGPSVRQLIPYSVETVSGVTKTITPERPTHDKTVVTWCRFHRSLDNTTGTTVTGPRNYDNVLFYDGTVQNLPILQPVREAPPGTTTGNCAGWQRVPRESADSMMTVSSCRPSP